MRFIALAILALAFWPLVLWGVSEVADRRHAQRVAERCQVSKASIYAIKPAELRVELLRIKARQGCEYAAQAIETTPAVADCYEPVRRQP